MAAIDVKTIYQLQLEPAEFSLVCKGLSGKLESGEIKAAAVLHHRMLEVRAKATGLMAQANEKSLQAAAKHLENLKDSS